MAETYEELKQEAFAFVASAAEFSMQESSRMGQGDKVSINEIIGMSTRVIAEVADTMQDFADEEEVTNAHN